MHPASTQAAALHGGPVHGWSGLERLRSEGLAWRRPALIGLVWHRWRGWLGSALQGSAGTARPGSPRRGMASNGWLGNDWSGVATSGQVRQAWHPMDGAAWLRFTRQARQVLASIGNARHAVATLAVQGVESLGPARQARSGPAQHDTAGLCFAMRCWLGTATPVWAPLAGKARSPMAPRDMAR